MIIGDSSALVALATMDRLDLLQKLFAKLNGLNVIGSLGVMLLARDKGLITSFD